MKMKKNYSLLIVVLMALSLSNSCTSHKKVINDDFAVDSADAGLSDADLTLDSELDGMTADQASNGSEELSLDEEPASGDAATDEFAEFGESSGDVAQNTDNDGISDLENELNAMGNETEVAQETPAPVTPEAPVIEETPAPEIVQVDPPAPEPIVEEAPPVPEVVSAPEPEITPSAPEAIAQVTNVEYKGNSNGGAFVVTSDIPLQYTTRLNASANQIIVEVQNAVISPKFTRALNTKDMSSSIDYINIYQKKGTSVARFVIQLRDGAPEPLVQPEGSSLLVLGSPMGAQQPSYQNVASNSSAEAKSESSSSAEDLGFKGIEPDIAKKGILSSRDLEDFLSGNNKFFGKDISIETSGMDVRDVLKFISEESGVNMVFDDDVKGTTAVRLRKVPWDQALVTILKSKKLGYRRQGSVLRIAKTTDLIEEDRVAIDLEKAKQTVEPLVVKNFAVNYADVNDLASKIEKYIADGRQNVATRGRVTGDTRTNTLIVSETAKKLKEVEQLITALDTQPQQVMIEARIVEAKDTWSRTIAGQVGANRLVGTAGTTAPIPGQIVRDSTTLKSGSAGYTNAASAGRGFVGNIFFGSFGAFGSLDAQLRLDEQNDKVKILSSPRVAVLTNTAAEINQGVTIMIPQTTNNQGTTITTYTPVPAGVKLKVTPQISNIGTVKLKMDVSRSSVSDLTTGSTDNRSATTEVIVKNGDTAVIGGVFQSDIIDQQNGIPGLKDIPILGMLFKGDTKSNTKTELMMFVSPRIIPLLNPPTLLKADSSESVTQ